MTMAHSINLCCGIPNFTPPGWTINNGVLRPGDRVGVLIDTRTAAARRRENGDAAPEGADIYFAVNGKLRPVAFTGVTYPLSFSISMCSSTVSHEVETVARPIQPTEIPSLWVSQVRELTS